VFVAAFLSLLMIVLDQRTTALQPVRQGLSILIHPILIAINSPFNFALESTQSIGSRATLLEENRSLKSEALILKAKLQKFEALEMENIRLHALLESSYKLGEQFIVGNLISVSLDPYQHKVTIDKGAQFGAYVGQAALDADGVIGQVTRVMPLHSEVMLITDPNHAIPVEVNRNGLRTIAVGSGQFNRLELPYLPHNANVEVGDLLISSGLGGHFPKGYPVGVISELEPAPGLPFMRASAKPAAHIESSRELLLVWSKQQPIPLSDNPVAGTDTLEQPEASAAEDEEPQASENSEPVTTTSEPATETNDAD